MAEHIYDIMEKLCAKYWFAMCCNGCVYLKTGVVAGIFDVSRNTKQSAKDRNDTRELNSYIVSGMEWNARCRRSFNDGRFVLCARFWVLWGKTIIICHNLHHLVLFGVSFNSALNIIGAMSRECFLEIQKRQAFVYDLKS